MFGHQLHPQRPELYTQQGISQRLFVTNPTNYPKLTVISPSPYTTRSFPTGQVAQLVERGPEKAGVGGSIPSLATTSFNNLATA